MGEGHCLPDDVNWYSVVPWGPCHADELQRYPRRLLCSAIIIFLHMKISMPKVRGEIVCKNYLGSSGIAFQSFTWDMYGTEAKKSCSVLSDLWDVVVKLVYKYAPLPYHFSLQSM